MGLIGAIIGDIVGSRWEFIRPRNLDWENITLLDKDYCAYTDDTVLSIATAFGIENKISFAEVYRMFARQYKHAGYGKMFYRWMESDDKEAYNSYGNGSAMRISYIADKFDTEEEVVEWAKKSASVTHNHPEGIKGAVVTAVCSFMAKKGATKEEIYNYVKKEYGDKYAYEFNIDVPMEELRKWYRWSVSCQDSVPVAIRCFLESDSYEGFLRNVLSLPCDSDTLAAIGGCIAENYYGTTGLDNDEILKEYLDEYLYACVCEVTT